MRFYGAEYILCSIKPHIDLVQVQLLYNIGLGYCNPTHFQTGGPKEQKWIFFCELYIESFFFIWFWWGLFNDKFLIRESLLKKCICFYVTITVWKKKGTKKGKFQISKLFSSHDLKGHVWYCHHLVSVVVCKHLHFNIV